MAVIDLHILQAYPPSLLNRDDTGQPKTAVFGGVVRTRVSSQSLRRAQRTYTEQQGLIPDANLARRTRHLAVIVAERLNSRFGMSEADGLTLAVNTVWGMGLLEVADPEHRTRALLFLGTAEIERLAAAIAARATDLLGAAVPHHWIGAGSGRGEDGGQPRNSRLYGETAECPGAFREFGRTLLGGLDATGAVDVALYGRFLAANRRMDVDGASSTAHAFSVGEHRIELDQCTVVDDHEDAHGDPLAAASLTAPTLYRYSNLDIRLLTRNLGGDRDLAGLATTAWLTAALHAVPRAKKTSTAPATRPLLALAVIRDDQALSLANAFLRPVRPSGDLDEGRAAATAICRHWGHMQQAYGHQGVRACYFVYADDAALLPLGMPGESVSAAELSELAADAAREAVAA